MFGRSRRRSQRGVALIITVIMLSVITFLAVAFLALSGREKGAVKVNTDQTTAREAAISGLERAKAELLANILVSGNLANFDLLVSTNYINWNGFDTASLPDPDRLTNVNYYLPNGNPLAGNNALQNLANLFLNPSAPVFITNRFAANSVEFRSYLDLNRNGRFDRTGFWGVTNNLNQPILDNSNRFVTNYVVGDPQWIGGLERIELPHSSSNKFVYRYAYAAVPVGKTLDVNYIHNQALSVGDMGALGQKFFRNQGVGPWEINLAALLYDLNTNSVYGWGGNGNYTYSPLLGSTTPAGGNAFADAGALYHYRLNGNPNNTVYGLPNVFDLYGIPGVNAFLNDYVDGYTDGPLCTTNGLRQPSGGLLTENDQPRRQPWVGADQPYHFFTTQDLFDPRKVNRNGGGFKFTDRLLMAGTNASTYDQSTYYRLLSQLGTDSAPDDADRLNLNFKNTGGLSATNFVRWTPLDFFTNAADRLLAKYTQEWLDTDRTYYTNFFGTNQAFGVTRIPVLISNRFVYSPSVHRLLQVSANIVDTKTDTLWPSVFRPIFDRDNLGGLYITGYEQVPTNNLSTIHSQFPLIATNVLSGTGQRIDVYGVPWVVGAKKGLPNFNEVSMHTLFQITRKLQVTRSAVNAPKSSWRTNLMYVVGTSNAIGIEAWNSYRPDFTNPVVITVLGGVTMVLTNEYGIPLSSAGPLNRTIPLQASVNTNLWRGYGTSATPKPASFIVPLRTNIAFLPESAYKISSGTFTTNLNLAFEASQGFPQLKWGLFSSVRLRVVMQLGDVNGPILDYVQLDDLSSYRDLSEEIRDPDLATGFDGLWSTNAISGRSTLPQSIQNQMDISFGNYGTDSTQWKSYDRRAGSTAQVQAEVNYFKAFFGLGGGLVNTSLVQQVPFTPTRRVLQEFSWQANDPLVHYMANDLLDLTRTNNVEKPLLSQPLQLLKNIGVINNRYSPWGGNPTKEAEEDVNRYDVAVKDPLVLNSDSWQFPTNVLPGLGWLGRIHRGTPWQTIYMKASDLNIPEFTTPMTNLSVWLSSYTQNAQRWGEWSGNPNFLDAFFTRPATDRLLFDVFTTALNENASRGQLSVNQTNLAAWSAVFSGVVALTNWTSTNSLRSTVPTFGAMVIEPAGYYDPFAVTPLPPLVRLVSGINAERTRTLTGTTDQFVHRGGSFQSAGDILSVPALSLGAPVFVPDNPSAAWPREGVYYWTNETPFLSFGNAPVRGKSDQVPALGSDQLKYSINDAALEWLPQQIMSLVKLGEPRFVIYAYGQALRPAESSIVTATGPFFGMCTNYQPMAEVAARAVVRVEGSANPADANNANPKRRYPPHLVVESYNFLPPE